ncbi:MAG: MFS transporter [Kangiellaceae bacterium]|nr:MFS transporter [Kangiellaceae bacterium]
MWILLFGAFITRGSFYMVWPFLTVILFKRFGISATQVGLILSTAAIISVFVGFIGGALSDIFGRQKLMYASGILYILSFSLLAQVDTIIGYVIVMTLCSIANALWRPITSALIGDIIKDAKTRELAMQVRYFVVNVGAALGPLIGFWLGLTGEQSSFYFTAIAFAILLACLAWGFSKENAAATERQDGKVIKSSMKDGNLNQRKTKTNKQVKSKNTSQTQLKRTFTILLKDRVLQLLIIANILCMLIYGQMDSSLIQYLTRAEIPDLLKLISTIIFTNAMVIITTQFLLLRIMASLSLIKRIQIGLILLTISQIWLALNSLELFWGWIGAIIVMSLAEAILFPTMNVHIDQLAPPDLRGAYFGAASFYDFGFAAAPLIGGVILDYLGGSWLFFIGALLSLTVMYLYRILEQTASVRVTL